MLFIFLLTIVTLVACKPSPETKTYIITFNSNGGTNTIQISTPLDSIWSTIIDIQSAPINATDSNDYNVELDAETFYYIVIDFEDSSCAECPIDIIIKYSTQ